MSGDNSSGAFIIALPVCLPTCKETNSESLFIYCIFDVYKNGLNYNQDSPRKSTLWILPLWSNPEQWENTRRGKFDYIVDLKNKINLSVGHKWNRNSNWCQTEASGLLGLGFKSRDSFLAPVNTVEQVPLRKLGWK